MSDVQMDSFRNFSPRDVWAHPHARASTGKPDQTDTMGRGLLWGVPIGITFWLIIAALVWMT